MDITLDAVLARIRNDSNNEFGKPVPEEQIQEMQKKLGVTFPGDLKRFYSEFGPSNINGCDFLMPEIANPDYWPNIGGLDSGDYIAIAESIGGWVYFYRKDQPEAVYRGDRENYDNEEPEEEFENFMKLLGSLYEWDEESSESCTYYISSETELAPDFLPSAPITLRYATGAREKKALSVSSGFVYELAIDPNASMYHTLTSGVNSAYFTQGAGLAKIQEKFRDEIVRKAWTTIEEYFAHLRDNEIPFVLHVHSWGEIQSGALARSPGSMRIGGKQIELLLGEKYQG